MILSVLPIGMGRRPAVTCEAGHVHPEVSVCKSKLILHVTDRTAIPPVPRVSSHSIYYMVEGE